MNKRSTADYIQLGTNIRYLVDAEEGISLHSEGGIVTNLEGMLEFLEELELDVTRRLADRRGLPDLLESFQGQPPDAVLTEEESFELTEGMDRIRDSALAEADGLFAYVATEKRLDVMKLLDDPAALFPPGIFAGLSDQARYDVTEAFKCLAFERATGAAFHLMRSAEEALRCLYLATVKQKRLKVLMWGPMTNQLRARRKSPPEPLLAQLDHVRTNFRNPTQHPDAVYDIHEAQDLAFITVDILTRLHRAMPG